MIPPVVDSEPHVTVHFEPLPDARELRQRQQSVRTDRLSNVNASQLRPKIAQISHDRVDSDDEGEVLTNDALLLQERVKLEKLLCKLCSRAIVQLCHFVLISFSTNIRIVLFLKCYEHEVCKSLKHFMQ